MGRDWAESGAMRVRYAECARAPLSQRVSLANRPSSRHTNSMQANASPMAQGRGLRMRCASLGAGGWSVGSCARESWWMGEWTQSLRSSLTSPHSECHPLAAPHSHIPSSSLDAAWRVAEKKVKINLAIVCRMPWSVVNEKYYIIR